MKGKGKAWDEDEEMENNGISNIENAGIYDGVDKSNNGQLSDIVIDIYINFEENDDVFEAAVHPLLLHLIRTAAIEPLQASFFWWAIVGATSLYILKTKRRRRPQNKGTILYNQ